MVDTFMTNGDKKQFVIKARKYDPNSGSWRPLRRTVELTADEAKAIMRAAWTANGSGFTSKEVGILLGSFMETGQYRDVKVCMAQ